MKHTYLFLFIAFLTTQVSGQNWTLVWSDEFDGTSLNLSDWNYDLGTGSQYGLNGWGNNELQYYEADNVSVAGGFLTIQALEESAGGMDYTSGKIHTKTKQTFSSGKIEARIKAPTDQGMWPAFWMLTDPGNLSENSDGWPPEIDIFESVGYAPSTAHGTIHAGVWPDVISNGGSTNISPAELSDDFHTYTIEWYNDNIVWYMDGVEYHSVNRTWSHPNPWQFDDVEWFLILNLAVGGNWPGPPDGSTQYPAEMQVDWIRVYSYDPTDLTNVTFRVDMSEMGLAPTDVVHINGTWNTWCGGCNPLTEISPGIWETTLPIPVGVHEYKFTTNGWTGLEESFAPGLPCTITTGTYTNRVINVQFDDLVQPMVCFNSCEWCPGYSEENCNNPDAVNYNPLATFDDGSCLFEVQFIVDMQDSGYNPADGVYLNGDFNGWCGWCGPMSDSNGDDIWEGTFNLPAGPIEYKFTTNGWDGLVETFTPGGSCTLTTGEFTNRLYQVLPSAGNTTGEYCFNSCEACLPSEVNVTFTVDMSNETLTANGVALAGDFNGFDPTANPMTHLGLGIYETTIPVAASSTLNYAFVNGNDLSGQEVVPLACSTGGTRDLTTSTVDIILDMVCFGGCALCPGCTDPLFAEYNPFAGADDGSCAIPYFQGCTYPEADNYNAAATTDDGSCLFNASSDCAADIDNNGSYGTGDLLALLALFGSTCE